jgi:hypothetical protein
MRDNFNKSINGKFGYQPGTRGDKSAILLDRSGLGLPTQLGDKSMAQETADRSILRGLGLHADQSRYEDRAREAQGTQIGESRD